MSGFLALALPAVLLLAALMIFARRGEEIRMPEPRSGDPREDEIDWDELEQAEREIRDLGHDGHGGPPEQATGEDWGPGTPRPPAA